MSLRAAIGDTLATAMDVPPFVKADKPRTRHRWMEETAAASQGASPSYELYANQAKAYAQSAWVYVCVSRINATIAGAPFNVFETEGEEKIAVPNHPLEQVLQRPNDRWSGFELMEAISGYLELCGNAYLYVNPNQGPPLELWPLRPDRMTVVPDRKQWIKGYVYTVGGVPCPLSREEVIHLKRWHPLRDYQGLSAIEAAALAVELDNKALVWDLSFFKESAVPSAIVDVGNISDADYEHVQKRWMGKYKGASRAHKTAFIRGGDVKVSTLSISQKDMQLLETMGATKEMICNIFGHPLGLLSENATEANAKVAERSFMNQTIYPKLLALGSKLSAELLSRYGPGLVGEFEDVRIGESKEVWLQELDIVTRGVVGPMGLPEPLMDRDEIREKYFDMQPMIAPRPSPAPVKPAPEEGGEEDDDDEEALKAELRRWRDVSLRLVRNERNPAEREFKSAIIPDHVRARITEALWLARGPEEVKAVFADPFGAGSADPAAEEKRTWEQRLIQGLLEMWRRHAAQAMEWLQKQRDVKKRIKAVGEDLAGNASLWAGFEQDYTQLLLPAFEEVMAEAAQTAIAGLPFQIGIDWTLVNTAAAEWARGYTYDLISGINDTTAARLQAAINNWIEAGETLPDLTARVEKIFNNPVRAEMIAATEITRVYAEANTLAWKESGVVKGRRWVTANDERVCPICAPLGGLTVTEGEALPASIPTQRRRATVADIDKPFIHPVTGEEYENPPAHVGCRCWVAAVV